MKINIKFCNTFLLLSVLMITGCQKDFLEKPNTTGSTTLEVVFSNKTGAERAIATVYGHVLSMFHYNDFAIDNGVMPAISGETSYGESWMSNTDFINSGFRAQARGSNAATSPDNFFRHWSGIRASYNVMENVEKVADMTEGEKQIVKAEMKALLSYRYLGMFIAYGGVPLVYRKMSPEDDLNIPRASLQSTLDFIIKNTDEAAEVLPNSWEDKFAGRMTKGAAKAIKARALLYAARPLYNSATPYMAFSADSIISFKSNDINRWNAAIAAAEDVIAWGNANGYTLINTGGAGANIPNPHALDDYGRATSTPSNEEVILAYKNQTGNTYSRFYNGSYTNARYLHSNTGLLTNFLENYLKADGTEQSWPGVGAANARPFSDYLTRMREMEPRFVADLMPHTDTARNNYGDNNWAYQSQKGGSAFGPGMNLAPSGRGKGAAVTTKFYYKAGNRMWFDFPIFRMAESYLALAEAYNEIGNTAKALENLNLIRNRGGLPSVTTTDQAALRSEIQREWAKEFFMENRRFFDVRHWKHPNLKNGMLAGPMREIQATRVSTSASVLLSSTYGVYYDAVVFTAFWNDNMYLLPIPQAEVDKGVVLQNPGY